MASYTFTIIKPDSTQKGHTGSIIKRISNSGFKTVGIKTVRLTEDSAKSFYKEHTDKPFFKDLIKFMTSAEVTVMVLERQDKNAVEDFRKLIGDTDPKLANIGTIRNLYGTEVSSNAIHGADSDESASREILFFFPELLVRLSPDIIISESIEWDRIDENVMDLVKKAVEKGGEFAKSVWDVAKREGRETKQAIKILSKLIQREEVPSIEKKFLKAQSFDLIKIIPLVAISGIPVPVPLTPLLIVLGKKIGFDFLPNSHTKVDYQF